jgi:hypothetical protein
VAAKRLKGRASEIGEQGSASRQSSPTTSPQIQANSPPMNAFEMVSVETIVLTMKLP